MFAFDIPQAQGQSKARHNHHVCLRYPPGSGSVRSVPTTCAFDIPQAQGQSIKRLTGMFAFYPRLRWANTLCLTRKDVAPSFGPIVRAASFLYKGTVVLPWLC